MPSFIAEEPLNSVRVFWLDQESLIREIHKVARRVGEGNENAFKIVLFGSLAERIGVPGSDADERYLGDKPYPSCLLYGQTFGGDPVHSVWAFNENNKWAV